MRIVLAERGKATAQMLSDPVDPGLEAEPLQHEEELVAEPSPPCLFSARLVKGQQR